MRGLCYYKKFVYKSPVSLFYNAQIHPKPCQRKKVYSLCACYYMGALQCTVCPPYPVLQGFSVLRKKRLSCALLVIDYLFYNTLYVIDNILFLVAKRYLV